MRRKGPRFTPDERRRLQAKALEMFKESETSAASVARELGVDPRTVCRWLTEKNVKVRRRKYDRDAVLADIKAGVRPHIIVRKYGCSWTWLYRLRKGEL